MHGASWLRSAYGIDCARPHSPLQQVRVPANPYGVGCQGRRPSAALADAATGHWHSRRCGAAAVVSAERSCCRVLLLLPPPAGLAKSECPRRCVARAAAAADTTLLRTPCHTRAIAATGAASVSLVGPVGQGLRRAGCGWGPPPRRCLRWLALLLRAPCLRIPLSKGRHLGAPAKCLPAVGRCALVIAPIPLIAERAPRRRRRRGCSAGQTAQALRHGARQLRPQVEQPCARAAGGLAAVLLRPQERERGLVRGGSQQQERGEPQLVLRSRRRCAARVQRVVQPVGHDACVGWHVKGRDGHRSGDLMFTMGDLSMASWGTHTSALPSQNRVVQKARLSINPRPQRGVTSTAAAVISRCLALGPGAGARCRTMVQRRQSAAGAVPPPCTSRCLSTF